MRTNYKTPDSLRLLAKQYDAILQKKYGETRQPWDTETEVLERIRKKSGQDIAALRTFIHEFQAVRFGNRATENLKDLLKEI